MDGIRILTIVATALSSAGCYVVPGYSVTELTPAIHGRVFDKVTQAPVPSAAVKLHFDGEVRQVAMTDEDGRFQIEPLRQWHWGTLHGPLRIPQGIPHGDVRYRAGRARMTVEHPQYSLLARSFNFHDGYERDEWARTLRAIDFGLDPEIGAVAESATTGDRALAIFNP
jgi:hypothetical protein